MKKCFAGLLILGFFSLSLAAAPLGPTREILKVLELQKEAWNRGDLEGYMAYYWKSDQLTFQSGANRVRGWETLMERYKEGYSGDRMGQLDFSDLEVKVLGRDYALVLGRWNVDIKGEKKGGVFTLVLKKFPEGWRIIHDHTS
ncbi:MAG: nuclear transport factor 2 family protein [Candidatus Saccharicenans sp.]|jgi:beta-aspartyl-peptidase (threonine type)|nr:nuclear transport factor 2 family protein [Candidatus Saccharicenans sp.]MDH7575846.1 nuclear transport factor 2 family protein [Candidatus Saccharicenans sp.]